MNASEVINCILKNEKIKAAKFAKNIGVKATQIYDLQSGKTKNISSSMADKITTIYPYYNRVWLLTGFLPMLKEEYPTPTAYVSGMSANYQGNFTQPIHTEIGHRNEVGKITKNNIEDILKKENEKLKQQVSLLEAQMVIKDEIIEAKNKAIEEKERLIEEKDKRIEEKERLIKILLDKK